MPERAHADGSGMREADLGRTRPRVGRLRLVNDPLIVFCFAAAVVLSLASALECHFFVSHSNRSLPFLPSLLYGFSVWLWLAPLALAVAFGLQRSHWLRKLSVGMLLLQLLLAFTAASLHLRLLTGCVQSIVHHWPALWAAGYNDLSLWSWQRVISEALVYLLVWAAGWTVMQERAAQSKAIEASTLRENLTEAELLALQRQMQPHFLLNTLNSIIGLLESGEHHDALEVTRRLSALTRRSVARDLPAVVAVADELRITEAYLAIEQVRFGDRLQVELSVDPAVLRQQMPPFLLQPLVENAVKHSTRHNLDCSTVRVHLASLDERLTLQISDNGAGLRGPGIPGTGISLQNIHDRLHLLYRDRYQLEMRTAAQGGCEVNVSFPAESRPA